VPDSLFHCVFDRYGTMKKEIHEEPEYFIHSRDEALAMVLRGTHQIVTLFCRDGENCHEQCWLYKAGGTAGKIDVVVV
jgi:hypothetical protein